MAELFSPLRLTDASGLSRSRTCRTVQNLSVNTIKGEDPPTPSVDRRLSRRGLRGMFASKTPVFASFSMNHHG